jgi:FkbM family methyltransferase
MVFAFEPHPANFSDLQRNKNLNSLDNLIPVQKAVAIEQRGRFFMLAHPRAVIP